MSSSDIVSLSNQQAEITHILNQMEVSEYAHITQLSHNQNSASQWSTQSHAKNYQGGRAHLWLGSFVAGIVPYYPPINQTTNNTENKGSPKQPPQPIQQAKYQTNPNKQLNKRTSK